jgi:hypothetical protein
MTRTDLAHTDSRATLAMELGWQRRPAVDHSSSIQIDPRHFVGIGANMRLMLLSTG